MGRPEGAVGARRRRVAVDAVGLDADRIPAVGARRRVAGGRRDARAVVGIRAGVHPEAHVARPQGAVGSGRRPHPAAHAVAARGHHRLLDPVDDPHRPPGLACEGDRQGLHLGVGLGAEAAAQVPDDDADRADLEPEEVGDLGLHEERVLAVRPQRHAVAVVVGDRGVGLHRVLVDGREGVGPFDDDLVRRGRSDLAGLEQVAVADVAVGLAEVAEAVKEADLGTALVQRRRTGCQRRVDRAEYGQLLVVDLYRAHGRLGGGLAHRGDGGDRLAGEPHAIDCHDRAVLDRVSVIGLDVIEVRRRQDRRHALERQRRRGVDPADQGMGVGAPHDLAVQHPGHLHVADVLRLPAQLLSGVLARLRDPDFAEQGPLEHAGGLRHRVPPAREPQRGSSDSPCSGRCCRRARGGSARR